jgi:hypothetical protein
MKLHSVIESSDRASMFLNGFPDSDHGGCLDSAKSTSGNYLELCSSGNTVASEQWTPRDKEVYHTLLLKQS